MLALSAACEPPPIDTLTRFVRVDDAIEIGETPIPDGLDPWRMEGPMGSALRGGRLGVEDYRPGAEVRVSFAVDGDVGVPLDEDGLVLWSFYAHLHEAHHDFLDRGLPVEPLAPFDAFAWTPASVMDFQAAENAAYAPAAHIFILFPDMVSSVPLAANDGVVRHEYGHSLFQILTVGELRSLGPMLTLPAADALGTRAVNEGFADMVATLSLDDPAFIERSLDMPSRDVRGDAVATDDRYPPDNLDAQPLGALGYDPYALGTVLASLAWDIRLILDDPALTLEHAVAAAQRWGADDHWGDADAFAALLVEEAARDVNASTRAQLCDAMLRRVPRTLAHPLSPCGGGR